MFRRKVNEGSWLKLDRKSSLSAKTKEESHSQRPKDASKAAVYNSLHPFSSNKNLKNDDDVDDSDSDDNNSTVSSSDTADIAKSNTFSRLMNQIRSRISYENSKAWVRWALDYAFLEFQICYEDLALLLTIIILVGPSFAYFNIPRSLDIIPFSILVICISIFSAELVLATWSKSTFNFGLYEFSAKNTQSSVVIPFITWKGFFGSLVWVLDVTVILSLIPDLYFFMNNSKELSINVIVLCRFIRMFRLIRIVKVYYLIRDRSVSNKRRLQLIQQSLNDGNTNMLEDLRELEKTQAPGKLAELLCDSITTRVILVIVVFLIVTPLIMFRPNMDTFSYSTALLQSINEQNDLPDYVRAACINALTKSLNDLRIPAIYLEMSSYQSQPVVNNIDELDSLRNIAIVSQSQSFYNLTELINYYTVVEYSNDLFIRVISRQTFAMMFLVCLVTIVATITINYDVTRLVLKPIERMMQVVELVAKNPLANINFRKGKRASNEFGSIETDLLEKTFVKIAGLLRVGFGEAGAGIIKSNLALNKGDNNALINPLLPGVRVYCIIGFCDIHQFDFVMKSLGKDVLVFVNTVAAVVHENVHSWAGSCNKNLGNAFVLIWRIGDEASLKLQQNTQTNLGFTKHEELNLHSSSIASTKSKKSSKSPSTTPTQIFKRSLSGFVPTVNKIDLKRLAGVDKLAGKALIGFLKIISELDTNSDLNRFNRSSKLAHKNRRFHLHMGFGLHAGWAIEGAVGSLQKVDATYLSPHVNMAARLETASRQYGVPLLVSQDFYELLSPYIQKLMRRLDVVTVKGSETPIGIYTYDTTSRKPTKRIANKEKEKSRSEAKQNIIKNNLSDLKLFINRIECEDIKNVESLIGKNDIYVKFYWNNETFQTKVIEEAGSHATFDDADMVLESLDSMSSRLYVEVWDKNNLVADTFIGSTELSLDPMKPSENHRHFQKEIFDKKNKKMGSIKIVLQILQMTNDLPNILQKGYLLLQSIKVTDLINREFAGNQDAYCILELASNEWIKQTNTMEAKNNVVLWDKLNFDINIAEVLEKNRRNALTFKLKIKVFDEYLFRKHVLLGIQDIKLDQYITEYSEEPFNVKLDIFDDHKIFSGHMVLTFTFQEYSEAAVESKLEHQSSVLSRMYRKSSVQDMLFTSFSSKELSSFTAASSSNGVITAASTKSYFQNFERRSSEVMMTSSDSRKGLLTAQSNSNLNYENNSPHDLTENGAMTQGPPSSSSSKAGFFLRGSSSLHKIFPQAYDQPTVSVDPNDEMPLTGREPDYEQRLSGESSKSFTGGSNKSLGSNHSAAPLNRSTSSKGRKSKKRHSIFNSSHDPDDVISNHSVLVNLRSHIDDTFTEEFNKGVNKYVSGEWVTAKEHLENCDEMMRKIPFEDCVKGDGPSQTLLEYMKSYEFIAPSDWHGFRPLTSK